MKKILFVLSIMFALGMSTHVSAQNAEKPIPGLGIVDLRVAYCNNTMSSYSITCEVMPAGYNVWLYNGMRNVPGLMCMADDVNLVRLEVGKRYDIRVGSNIYGGFIYRTYTFTIKSTDEMILVNLYTNSLAPEVFVN